MSAALATANPDFVPGGSTRAFTQRLDSGTCRGIVDRCVSEALRGGSNMRTGAAKPVGDAETNTTIPQAASQAAPKVINVPQMFRPAKLRGRAINTLQEWEGIIDRVEADGFEARLRDLTEGSRATEFAWIPIDEVDPKDLSRVRTGAVFHLIVAFCRRGGGRKRETEMYFRRHLPSAAAVTSEVADLLDFFEEYAA